MKKLFLLLIVIFATASGSFAWTGSQSLYAYGYQSGPYPGLTDTQGMTVNINSYCYDVQLTGYVYTEYAPGTGMSAGAWLYNNSYDRTYEYLYPNTSNNTYINYRAASGSGIYWDSIHVVIEAYLASMAVTLLWETM